MAKCTHCSAPLPKSGIICEYCGVRNDIDLRDKKFVNLRPHLNRECPICNIKLQTINIGTKLDLFIERCESCYGIFFDPNELEEMLEYSVKGSKNVDLLKLAQISENPRYIDILTYRKCPVCKKTMQRKNFMKRSGVITDICFEHGIWLDSGELRQIMEWVKVGGMTKIEESKFTKASETSYTSSPKNSEYSGTKETDIFEDLLDALLYFRW
ncbi:zf-TFIIB domain-containing protein [Sulfurimonas sp.]|jgi:Zn-finger nucleic acid-binding protein|uniref:TFIIB-type zinc ribbon-containing protein n=1 Tax=Sulfurimonas sp. TaxID=2022749 RepID=UPI002600884C|nr:zf-TFIIB domain-containing protein [Sulfurimonas sp.]MBT5935510.1 zf-TFIIB domain-containing protein [Sulfurimonas sp.]